MERRAVFVLLGLLYLATGTLLMVQAGESHQLALALLSASPTFAETQRVPAFRLSARVVAKRDDPLVFSFARSTDCPCDDRSIR